jgi:hypothetical protein
MTQNSEIPPQAVRLARVSGIEAAGAMGLAHGASLAYDPRRETLLTDKTPTSARRHFRLLTPIHGSARIAEVSGIKKHVVI